MTAFSIEKVSPVWVSIESFYQSYNRNWTWKGKYQSVLPDHTIRATEPATDSEDSFKDRTENGRKENTTASFLLQSLSSFENIPNTCTA